MKHTRFLDRIFFPALLIALLATAAYGQIAGKLTGTVTDPQGSVVSGAKVTAKNDQTQTLLAPHQGEDPRDLRALQGLPDCEGCIPGSNNWARA